MKIPAQRGFWECHFAKPNITEEYNKYVKATENTVSFMEFAGICAPVWIFGETLIPPKEKSYLEKSLNQITLGNYTDDVTELGTAGKILLGFTGLDVITDIRDLSHDMINWEWSWSHAGKTALDAIGLIPVIGSVKNADEAASIVNGVAKHGDDALDSGKQIAKHGDQLVEGAGSNFKGILKGVEIELPNVKTQKISYIKRNLADTSVLRNEFNSTARKEFMKDIASKNQIKLRDMGFSEKDITKMLDGKVPDDFQVHHKLPLDDGGNNNLDNLVLIKNDPYHKVITNYQNSTTKNLLPGEKIYIDWPIPEGNFYNGN